MPGVCRTYYGREATGNEDKLIVEIREDDGSISSYKVQTQQLEGKTEAEINTALDNWLSFNYTPDWRNTFTTGDMGVHINRDGSFCYWTGAQPNIWPEDVTGTFG